MSIFINTKFNSLPQQVDQNKKDIVDLQNAVIELNHPYIVNGELTPQTSAIDLSMITNPINLITNGFVVDSVGNYFNIINVIKNTVYLQYVFTIFGKTGVGIKEFQVGTPTVNGAYTFTPYTVVFDDDSTQSGEIAAANGASVTDVEFTPVASDDNTTIMYKVTTTFSNGQTVDSGDIVLHVKTLYQHCITIQPLTNANMVATVNLISTSNIIANSYQDLVSLIDATYFPNHMYENGTQVVAPAYGFRSTPTGLGGTARVWIQLAHNFNNDGGSVTRYLSLINTASTGSVTESTDLSQITDLPVNDIVYPIPLF